LELSDMAKSRFAVEIESNHEIAPTAFLSDWIERSIGITPCEPLPVDAHGEHGVDEPLFNSDGTCTDFNYVLRHNWCIASGTFKGPNLVYSRPTPPSESKEHSADCTCGMGIGSQPNAHHPKCGRFVSAGDTIGFVDASDKAVDDGKAMAVGDSEANGKQAAD
jgi:hypothetical protein